MTLAHWQAALWQAPLIPTTHATALLRLATARHPSAPSIPKLLVVTAARTHAFLLLRQRSHHYTRWTGLRTSWVTPRHHHTVVHLDTVTVTMQSLLISEARVAFRHRCQLQLQAWRPVTKLQLSQLSVTSTKPSTITKFNQAMPCACTLC
jgi:hypothetical protein